MNKKINIVDLFCGIGGFSLGFEKAGYRTVYAIDKWDDAVVTYNRNRKEKVAHNLPIEEFDSDKIKELLKKYEVDGVIGGPPCQGFSTVGTRDINDERNFLYLQYYRVVKEIKPKFFVIENVKGMLNLNDGMFREDIEKRFGELGYNINYKVLDAANFGVPQHRKRVFFVGLKKGEFEFPQELTEYVSTEEAIGDLPLLDGRAEYQEIYNYEGEATNNFQRMMRENSKQIFNHKETKHTDQTINVISMIGDGGRITDLPEEYWKIRKYNKSFQRMNSREPSHTIDTGHRNYFHYRENRVPTVRECCRIQSFPDDFILEGSKTSQYKQVGNAVPPLLAYHIAMEIRKYIYKK